MAAEPVNHELRLDGAGQPGERSGHRRRRHRSVWRKKGRHLPRYVLYFIGIVLLVLISLYAVR